MKHLLWLLLIVTPLVAAAPGDTNVLAAHNAFRRGDAAKLARELRILRTSGDANVLEPWVRYWQLRLRLEQYQKSADGVAELRGPVAIFLLRHEGSYLAQKLRGHWLEALGKHQRWDAFEHQYQRLVKPDQELSCYDWQARLTLQHDQSVLAQTRPLWFSLLDMPDACVPLMQKLIAAGRIDDDDIWRRMRLLFEHRRITAAIHVGHFLPRNQRPSARLLYEIARRPRHYLDRRSRWFLRRLRKSRLDREMVLFAVQRLASQDAVRAARAWEKIADKFSVADRAYAWGQIAWAAAQSHLPEALAWYARAQGAPFSDSQRAWQARAALRAENWHALEKTILNMPPKMESQANWTYWLGRALAAQGHPNAADALYLRIGGQPTFYGLLADDALGRPLSLPPRAAPPTADELIAAFANPGLERALALIRLGLHLDGVREWDWALRGMNDRQLLAAAEMARNSDAFDRSIIAAEHTLAQHDYALRYPAPFQRFIDPQAADLSLDRDWVYGLLRQESAFVINARSDVGARGLMQLMPRTARWVARKIGLKGYRASKMNDMDINVRLGTNYLHMVLQALDNQPVLAAAAYNAGPRRAREWCPDRPIEGAIYVETIPFRETRHYVEKVMSNAVYYAAVFDDDRRSLKRRLGTVGPCGAAAGANMP